MYIKAPIQPANVKNKSSKKGVVGILFFFFLVVLVAVPIFAYSQYTKALETPNSDSIENVDFTVNNGDSTDTIIENLVSNGLLDSSKVLFFKIYLRQSGSAAEIQAGNFRVPKNLTMVELANSLKAAKVNDIWVTIIEGLRADEIADVLEEAFSQVDPAKKVFSKEEYLALVTDQAFINELGLNTPTLEGYLFPDKYLFFETATARDVIVSQIEHLRNSVGEDFTNEDIIIASLVEREGRSNEDRYMIADIIKRRNVEGWFLNIDATILYYKGDWKHEITVADLKEDQPYNTYVYTGLPPTAIANPGLVSIKATLNPEPNEYYYYIHDDSGRSHYAETLAEHNQNISNYLR